MSNARRKGRGPTLVDRVMYHMETRPVVAKVMLASRFVEPDLTVWAASDVTKRHPSTTPRGLAYLVEPRTFPSHAAAIAWLEKMYKEGSWHSSWLRAVTWQKAVSESTES